MVEITPLIVGSALLVLFLVLGVPISASLLVAGLIGNFLLIGDKALIMLPIAIVGTIGSFSLSALPLFILMGDLVFHGGVAQDVFRLARLWFGRRIPGSTAVAATGANAAFAATCGSSIAATAVVGAQAIPEMIKQGYDKALACGAIAAAGGLAVLIPPSGALIIYGILTEQSIGQLFMAGLIPGVILTILYSMYIVVRVMLNPRLAPREMRVVPWTERLVALRGLAPILVLFVAVMGSIYAGICSATEAAGVGAFLALCIGFISRRLKFTGLRTAFREATMTTGMILLIAAGALIFGRFLVQTRATDELIRWVGELPLPPWGIMALINLLLIALGCFLEALSITMIILPVLYPIVEALGYDLVWFGIVFTINMELGLCTPPVGMGLFVIKGVVPDVPMSDIVRGSVPFVTCDCILIALLMAAPQLALWLPGKMLG